MTTILITRPERRAEPFRSQLQRLGAEVIVHPVIEIVPPVDFQLVDRALRHLKTDFDWVVFSSGNGVDFFFDRYETLLRDDPSIRIDWAGARLAVVGPGTDASLRSRLGRSADRSPKEKITTAQIAFSAEGILEELQDEASRGGRFLLPRADRGRDVLKKGLQEAGGTVTEIVVYRSVDRVRPDPDVLDRMEREEIDWVTATSSAIARALVAQFDTALNKTKIISISPLTDAVLTQLGYPSCLVACSASLSGIVETLAREIG